MIIGISGKSQSGKDVVNQLIYLWYYEQRKQILFNTTIPLTDNEMKGLLFLAKNNLNTITTIRFADVLKDMVCMLIGCTKMQLEDNQFKQTPLGEEWWYYVFNGLILPYDDVNSKGLLVKLTPRMLLQQLGTDCGRNMIHPNIWVNATNKLINQYPKSTTIVIPDVRFKNELNYLNNKKAITIRVERESIPKLEHQSEIELDNEQFKYVVHNNSSLWDLWLKVKEIMYYESKMY